ncbi:MAG: DNA adenine methylase [Opitutaceae bacterium]
MTPNTPLRYPGGKGKLTDFVRSVFEQNQLLDGHYVEPYAGGAGLALNLLMLDYASCIHLNDLDRSVYAFWHSVINSPDAFCKLLRDAKLNMTEWRRQKAILRSPEKHDLIELGFSLLYLNRTNRSGIVTGGVIGGNDQSGEWKIDARFNKSELCRRIEKIALHRSRIRLYNLDAADLITGVIPSLPAKTLVYLDPPYYSKAERLYKNIYKHDDHVRVAKLVKEKIKVPWIVSYDYMPEVIEIYNGSPKIVYSMNYSAANRYKGREVMFFSPRLTMPDTKNPANLSAA